MSDGLGIKVEGFAEVKRLITLLAKDKDKKREMLLILRQIAKPTLQAAKSFAPVSKKAHWQGGKREKTKIQPGNLKKSIGFIKPKYSDDISVIVGARANKPFNGWYAHFVEYRVNRYRSGFKRNRKKAGANASSAIAMRIKVTPFMAMARQATAGAATIDAERRMAKFMQRRINKLSK
jgi:hypothetical protein